MTTTNTNEISVELDSPNGPKVGYQVGTDLQDVEAEVPCGWKVDWDTTPASGDKGYQWSPLVRLTTAKDRLAELLAMGNNPDVIETDTYKYYGHEILIATVIGDPDSDGDEYYSDEVYVAWDAGLDHAGERGACTVSAREFAAWRALRWPATVGHAGFARDGSWCEDGRRSVRSW